MKNKFNHYLYIIAPMVIILVIVFVAIKFIMPLMFSINGKRNELSSAKEKLVRMQNKRTILETVTGVYSEYLSDATLALPSEKNPETILTALENISAQTQYSIDSITLNPGAISSDSAKKTDTAETTATDNKRGAQFLTLNIHALGLTASFPNFLTIMQNTRRLFDITTVNLSFTTENNNTTTVDLMLNAYYLPAVSQIGAVDADLPKITDKEQQILKTLAQMPVTTEMAISTSSGQMPVGKANLFEW